MNRLFRRKLISGPVLAMALVVVFDSLSGRPTAQAQPLLDPPQQMFPAASAVAEPETVFITQPIYEDLDPWTEAPDVPQRWNPEFLLTPLEPLPVTIHGFTVVDSWRGVPDGHFQNNNGVKKGVNVGALLPGLAQWGIGAQLGASYGLYRSTGHYTPPNASSEIQQQTFVTAGLFRHATPNVPLAAGFVYDGMINDSYGVFAQSPYLSQFRAQVGYVLNRSDELGFWMTQHGPSNTHYPDGIATSWRAINQYNLFWHRNYQSSGADLRFWIGLPEHHRLNGSGSLGQLILGSYGSVPINERAILYANTSYMMPSAHASAAGSTEDSFYVGFGLAYFVGPKARHTNAAGNPTEPYLPVADNSTFFVDTTRTF
jgi:hypothetical protein